MSYLTHDPAFLTLEELANQVDLVVDQLSRNRTALIATGLPATVFGFGWLWQTLTYVYPVKLFNGLEMSRIEEGKQQPANYIGVDRPEYRCTYSWVCPVSPTTRQRSTSDSTSQPRKRKMSAPCSYQQAPCIEGLDAQRYALARMLFV